jgi:hypothetical protein
MPIQNDPPPGYPPMPGQPPPSPPVNAVTSETPLDWGEQQTGKTPVKLDHRPGKGDL